MSIKVMVDFLGCDFQYTKPLCKQSPTHPDRVRASGSGSSGCSNLSSSRDRGLGGLLGGLSGGSLGGGSLAFGGVNGVVLLAGRVDRDLNGDLTALDLLSVHLLASLLLELLGAECDETEAAALAGLTASLELLDHEAGDGAEGDLGLGGGVVLEDLEELELVSIGKGLVSKGMTHPVLLQVVGQVGNHDLGLGGNAVLGGTALLALAGLTRLTGSSILLGLVGSLLGCKRFVRSLGQRSNLAGYICRGGVGGRSVGELDLVGTLSAVGLWLLVLARVVELIA
jgi:hypothetical protein